MKEQAINKINKMGKVSFIITRILMAIVGVAMILTMIAGIITAMFPKDALRVTLGGDVKVEVNMDSLNGAAITKMTDQKMSENIKKLDEEVTLKIEDEEFSMVETKVEDGIIYVNLQKEAPRTFSIRDITYCMISAVVLFLIAFVGLLFTSKLCEAVRDCETPFSVEVIKRMRYLAFYIIPSSIGISALVNLILYRVGQSGNMITVNLNSIFVGLIVLGLAYIFKYGAVLQQESDETL